MVWCAYYYYQHHRWLVVGRGQPQAPYAGLTGGVGFSKESLQPAGGTAAVEGRVQISMAPVAYFDVERAQKAGAAKFGA